MGSRAEAEDGGRLPGNPGAGTGPGDAQGRCEGRAPDAFVFTAPRGGPWVYETFYEDRWVKIRDMAERKGLKKRMTMYGFRHSLLTWLASEGVNLIALRTIAGHKNVSTTFNFYVHNTRKHHPQVKAVVDDLVGMGLRMVEERAGAAKKTPRSISAPGGGRSTTVVAAAHYSVRRRSRVRCGLMCWRGGTGFRAAARSSSVNRTERPRR